MLTSWRSTANTSPSWTRTPAGRSDRAVAAELRVSGAKALGVDIDVADRRSVADALPRIRGELYDNALVESFFAALQTELLERHYRSSRAQLEMAIFDLADCRSAP